MRKVIEDDLLTDSGYRENLAEERVLKAFTAAGAKPDAASTLAALVNRRLLRIEERLDIRRVELTHDVLCGVVKLSREERKKREELAEAEQHLATQRVRAAATKKALIHARQIAAGCAVLSVIAVGSGGYGVYSAIRAAKAEKEAVAIRAISETSRGEAEKLVVFILDDFYEEMAQIGRLDVVGSLAKKALEYYAQLPAEARTAETQRNSAVAQSRYAQVLTTLGKGPDAQKQLDTATATIKALRDSGDTTDATLIAEARVNGALVGVFSNRADHPGAVKAGLDALAKLKPVLDKPDAPRAARVMEAQIAGTVAFSQKNMGDTAAALVLGQRALDLSKSLGALDLSDLPATANYIRTGWSQAETLTRVGKDADARTLLEECIALADKLLALRPGHRQALASKATAFMQLASIEEGKLNVADGLRYDREALKVQIEATALDPGSSRSQNNLRRYYGRICLALWSQGQIDAALPLCDKSFEPGKDERIDGFSALNLAFGHALYSGFQAALGDPPRAAREMAAAERYFAVMKTSGASPRSLANANAFFASKRGEIALMTGGAAERQKARSDVEQAITARIATFGGAAPTAGAAQVLSGDHASAAELALALKDFAGAEAHAKKSLNYGGADDSLSLRQQADLNDIRAILATALARQGKFDEAKQGLPPALAYLKLPLVMQTDDETMKYWNARVLLAAAIANGDKPVEKAKFLADAAKRFDAMPVALKRLKSHAMLREQIAAEGQR